MAMHAITRSLLHQGYDVKVISVATHKFFADTETVPAEYRDQTGYEAVFVDTRVKPLNALINLFKSESYHISRFFSRTFSERLSQLLKQKQFDIIIMESLFMTPYLSQIRRIQPDTPVLLRAHNIEHRIWERISSGEKNPVKRWYLRVLTRKLKRAECLAVKLFDGVIPITEIDAEWFRETAPGVKCVAVPFGLKTSDASTKPYHEPPLKLYHLGSMDWWPNVEAVDWLLNDCWQKCYSLLPGLELHIAGRNMSKALLQKKMNGLIVHGEIDDPTIFINSMHVLIAPIFSGSGIRIKILEAMAHGKVVITTKIGAEGIQYENGRNILIINDIEEIVSALEMLVDNPDLVVSIGENARTLIRDVYSPEKLSGSLAAFINGFINKEK